MSMATDIGKAETSTTRGTALGCAAALAFIIGGHFIYPASAPVSDAIPDRLTCYLPYLAGVAAPLMIGLLQQSRSRFDDAPNAYVQRTVALVVPAILVHLALLATLPYDWLNTVPLMALWLIIAGLVSLAGQSRGPAWSAFGYAAALAPSVVGAIAIPFLSVWNAVT